MHPFKTQQKTLWGYSLHLPLSFSLLSLSSFPRLGGCSVSYLSLASAELNIQVYLGYLMWWLILNELGRVIVFRCLVKSVCLFLWSITDLQHVMVPGAQHSESVFLDVAKRSQEKLTRLRLACLLCRRRQWHPLQYSCLEDPMDGGDWWAAVHGVAEGQTRLSNFTFTFPFMHWRRKWHPSPVFLPGESQGRGSLVGCSPWGREESDMTEVT